MIQSHKRFFRRRRRFLSSPGVAWRRAVVVLPVAFGTGISAQTPTGRNVISIRLD